MFDPVCVYRNIMIEKGYYSEIGSKGFKECHGCPANGMYVCMYVCMYVFMHVCFYACTYVCIYVRMHAIQIPHKIE